MFKTIVTYVLAMVGVVALLVVAYLIYRIAGISELPPLPMPEPQSVASQPVQEHDSSQQTTVEAKDGVLTISELGVYIPATDILSDLVYKRFMIYDDPSVEIYGLSTRSLMALVPTYSQGNCQPERGALGVLQLSQTGATLFDSTIVVKLGEKNYLLWDSPQDRCTDVPAAEALWREQLEAVRVAVKQAKIGAGPDTVSAWTDNLTITGYSSEAKPSLAASSTYVVDTTIQIDVDGDGVAETAQTLNWYGTNHCCFFAEIVKNGLAIFSFYNGNQTSFNPTDDHKGFYLQWRPEAMVPAMCCPTAYIETQFKWNGSVFVPIRERTVTYYQLF